MRRYTRRHADKGRHGFFAGLIKLFLLGVSAVYAVAALTAPWAFHIGGRSTPLLYRSGAGKLVTTGGTYPLFVYFYPSPHSSRLHLDGLRPTGGMKGGGSLCIAPGVLQRLDLSGTIYNGWSTTEDSLITFRMLESKRIDVGQRQGYFDLYGRFHGPQLVMDARGGYAGEFRSGLKLDHASVTLDWSGYSDFKSACENSSTHP